MQHQPVKVISIAGGKGGVGKTTLSVNLAVSLAQAGLKTLLFDADLSLANVDLLLGFHSKTNIADVLKGQKRLEEICLTGPHQLKIIPGASGVTEMADLGLPAISNLIHAFSGLSEALDVMLVDIAAGISKQVMQLSNAAQDIVMVICNEPSSMADAYAMMKILNQQHSRHRFGVVVNKARHAIDAQNVFIKFQAAATRFLDLNLEYLGFVPEDEYVGMAARQKKALVDAYPKADASVAIQQLSRRLLLWNQTSSQPGGIRYFVERLCGQGALEEASVR